MLEGRDVVLRPVREADLDFMYEAHTAIGSRGSFFPLNIMSESKFKREFSENGFWTPDEGVWLICTREGDRVGHIEFFTPVNYWDAFELSYQLYDEKFSGHGYTTAAVALAVDYLFGTKKKHRIHLVIVPENAASRRIAEKCGFSQEGTIRGAFFNAGRNQDVLMYSLLRTDPRPLAPVGRL